MHVYAIICDADKSPVTGTGKYYVGKTVTKNLQSYLRLKWTRARKGATNQPHLFRAMRKFPNYADWRIHSLMPTLKTNEELLRWETELISLMRCQNPDIGYNITNGGEGWSHNASWRKTMSLRFRGVNNPFFGKTHSEEVKRNVGKNLDGYRARLGKDGFLKHQSSAGLARWSRIPLEQRAMWIPSSIGGTAGCHQRWHVKRGIVNPNCKLCAPKNLAIGSS